MSLRVRSSHAVLTACVGILVALAWLKQPGERTIPEARAQTSASKSASHARKHYPRFSGIVQSIRELPAADNGARRFEMTLRMRDGSLRVSEESGHARWRAGDKVWMIGGSAPH